MTVPLTGTGGLFERLGHLFGGAADLLALQGGTATARVLSGASWAARNTTLQTDYATAAAGGTANPPLLNGDNGFGASATPISQILGSWNKAQTSMLNGLQKIAQNTLISMCDTDATGGLASRTIAYALQYLINQMTSGSTTVNATTVSVGAQTAVGSPVGNPTVVLSALMGNGQTRQYSWGETFDIVCTSDSQSGGQTAGQEQLTLYGGAKISSSFDYRWPGGSGISFPILLADPRKYNAGGNVQLLTNSDFTNWSNGNTGAPPDNWTALVGAAQMQRGATPYFANYALQFNGDSSTLTSAAQTFATAAGTGLGTGGTPAKLSPLTPYGFILFYKLSSASPTAGVLQADLVNASNATINDAAGTANSVSVNLHNVANTNWNVLTGFFRLPTQLPSAVKLRLSLTTALTTGTNVYIGGVGLNGGQELYTGGPFCSAFSGNVSPIALIPNPGAIPSALADTWTMSYTPTWGTMQQMLERFFGMKNLRLQVPNTTSSPTVADSLVA